VIHTPSPTLHREIGHYLDVVQAVRDEVNPWFLRGTNYLTEEVPVTNQQHFVVVNNTPGYLPEEDDPATFDTRKEAIAYLVDEVARYCQHLEEVDELFRVNWSDDMDEALVEHLDREHDLGRVFEILMAEEEV
jgi:hypothetical protein